MKLTLRVTLTTILLSLLGLTVGALGTISYLNSKFTAEDLSRQILDQTSRIVDDQINDLLHTASDQGRLNLRLIQSGQQRAGDIHRLARYWLDVMEVHPRLTRLSLGVEKTGEWYYVHRPGGKLAINELRRDPQTGKLAMTEYDPAGYPSTPIFHDPDMEDRDPRNRPWYVAAKRERRQVWSETYVLFGDRGQANIPGVTSATPIFAPDGTMLGALSASFDVIELSNYLRSLRVGDRGYAFVVEVRRDGTRRVIAHKDPKILTRAIASDGRSPNRELIPPEELADRTAVALLDRIPRDLNPSTLKVTGRVGFEHGGARYLGAYSCLSSRDTPDWLICIVMPEADVMGRVEASNRVAVGVGLGILVVATVLGSYVSTQVARPLERVARETEAIGQFRTEARPVAHSIVKEVDRLAIAVEQTKASLRSFRKYVPADLIRAVLATREESGPGGERREMTISFCDLADFTTVSEQLSPEDLVHHLAEYFGPLSAEIGATGGTVDKYIGDAIMAFWGAPAPNPHHAVAACASALRNQATLALLRPGWAARGKPELHARIGIHTGEVIVGNIGSEARLNYTVVGDPVNVASRLEGLGKHYGAAILIGETTRREAGPAIVARPVDRVSVKGKTRGLEVFELLALRGEGPPEAEEVAGLATDALARYSGRDWAGAIALYREILRVRPDDGPARILIARCLKFQVEPPAEGWDGVHRMVNK